MRYIDQLYESARARNARQRGFTLPVKVSMLRTSREGIDRFLTLQSFEEAEKRSLLKLVRRAEHRLAPYEFWRRRLEVVAVSTIAVLVATSVLLAPYLFELLSGRPDGIVGWVLGYAALPVAVVAATALGMAANAAAAYLGPRGLLLARAATAGAASTAVLLLTERNAGAGSLTVAAGAASISVAAVIGITLILELAFGAPMWILMRAVSYFEPESFVLDRLVRVLHRLDGHPAHWTNAKFRHDCIADLEYAATCIERDVGRRYRASPELHAWVRAQCRWRATALRRSACEVALGRKGARERLRRQLHEAVRHAALQQWAELSSAAPEATTTQTRAFATWLLGLVRAGLPAVALAALQETAYALHGTVLHYAAAAVVLWAVTGVVPLVDPHYVSKLRSVSSLRSEAEALVRNRFH